jgi:Flp pilus assembly protein CpaB
VQQVLKVLLDQQVLRVLRVLLDQQVLQAHEGKLVLRVTLGTSVSQEQLVQQVRLEQQGLQVQLVLREIQDLKGQLEQQVLLD